MDEPSLPSPPRRPQSMPLPYVPAQGRDRPPPLPPTPGRPTSLWQETLEEHRNNPEEGATSIGGWLILVAIGRVLAIPLTFFSLLHLWRTYSTPGLWSKLTSPDSPSYHPLWSAAIVYEVGGKTIVFLWSVVLVWLFFSRRRAFRWWFIAYSVLQLAYLWGDHYVAAKLVKGHNAMSPEQFGRLVGATISTMIWVPYFFVSERVRETFVR